MGIKYLLSKSYIIIEEIMNKTTKKILYEIRIDSKDKIEGFYTLLTNGSVVCLPDNEYIVPDNVLIELNKQGIKYTVLKK